jgi:hypothetical protein
VESTAPNVSIVCLNMSTPPREHGSIDLTHSPEFPLPHPVVAGSDHFIYGSSSSPEGPAPKRRIISSESAAERAHVTSTNDASTHTTTPNAIRRRQAAIYLESTPSVAGDSTYLDDSVVETVGMTASTSRSLPIPIPERPPSIPKAAPLSSYTCPICYSAPKDAALTLCGHIICGSCLFGSVRAARARALESARPQEAEKAYCPVCRAVLAGWDGRGGGVIGLEIKAKTG